MTQFPGWQQKTGRNRVALIVGGFPTATQPSRGIFNLRTAQGLVQNGIDVIVFFLRSAKPGNVWRHGADMDGLPTVVVPIPQLPGVSYGADSHMGMQFNLAMYRHLGWLMMSRWLKSCDILHSVGVIPFGVAASFWAKRAKAHHITQLTGTDFDVALSQSWKDTSVLGWDKSLHRVIANSNALRDGFHRIYPQVSNVQTIYRGVNLTQFHPEGAIFNDLAPRSNVKYGFWGGFPVYNGPYGETTKGGNILLAAWQNAEKSLIENNASLIIGGQNSNSPRVFDWRSQLKEPERVFITGSLNPGDMPAYMRSCDVIIVPSLQEGLPNVAMEASACGKAVFGSNAGGTPEVVEDGVTGLVLPAGDISALENALVKFAADPTALAEMGKRARKRMETHFDAQQYAPNLVNLYHTVLQEPL